MLRRSATHLHVGLSLRLGTRRVTGGVMANRSICIIVYHEISRWMTTDYHETILPWVIGHWPTVNPKIRNPSLTHSQELSRERLPSLEQSWRHHPCIYHLLNMKPGCAIEERSIVYAHPLLGMNSITCTVALSVACPNGASMYGVMTKNQEKKVNCLMLFCLLFSLYLVVLHFPLYFPFLKHFVLPSGPF